MINIKPIIYRELNTIGVPVRKEFSKVKEGFPCIVYQEIGNKPYKKSNGIEVISDISYQIEVYSKTDIEGNNILQKIDDVMSKMGFERSSPVIANTSKYYRTITRFSGKVDHRTGMVYQ